ncbi:MAG TPA: hypothetical protein VF230_17120 [Acidimicrobiales bacterium]
MASLRTMSQGPGARLDPDVGYWAERWDPDGSLHPLWYTSHLGDRWVNLTTLPMAYAALPLWELGGYRAALLLPMAGAVGAAFAAGAIAARLGGRRWLAFWAVGVASPLTIYALDFWEHAVGVALVGWATVLVWDAASGVGAAVAGTGAGSTVRRAAAAGLLLGLAATMRTETLVYAAILAAAAALSWIWARSRRNAAGIAPKDGTVAAFAGAVAFAVPLVANDLLERAVLGTSLRASRTASGAIGAGDAPTDRITEALYTTSAMEATDAGVVLGVAAAMLLALAAWRGDRDRPASDQALALVAVAGAAVLFAIRASWGLGFVPGLLAAWPLALMAGAPKNRAGFVVGVALAAIPIIAATQYRGGAGPQWAGRYLLASGLLLTAVGAAALTRLHRAVAAAVVALAAAVTVFGLAWLSVRSHDVADAVATIEAQGADVVVSGVAHLAREGGATYGDRRWLTATTDERVREAADVMAEPGADVGSFALVEYAGDGPRDVPEARDLDGWQVVAGAGLRLFDGVWLWISTWERVASTEHTFSQ